MQDNTIQDKLSELKKYARQTGKRVIAKLREKPDEDGDNIEPYDGDDAGYSGSDEEYEEFLKTVESNEKNTAEPVESTQKINIGEILGKMKKTTESVSDTVKRIKDDVSERMEDLKKDAQKASDDVCDQQANTSVEDLNAKTVNTTVDANIVLKSDEMIGNRLDELKSAVNELHEGAQRLREDMQNNAQKFMQSTDSAVMEQNESIKDLSAEISGLNQTVKDVYDAVADIQQNTASVVRLNDSIFDLRNAQVNTKNSLDLLEGAYHALKKKFVTCMTVLSLLVGVMIILEIIRLLS